MPAEPLACLVRRGHPGVGRRLTRRRYLELPHVVVGGPGAVDRALEAQGASRRMALRVPTFLVMPSW